MTFDVDWALNIIMLKINIKNYLKNNLSKSNNGGLFTWLDSQPPELALTFHGLVAELD